MSLAQSPTGQATAGHCRPAHGPMECATPGPVRRVASIFCAVQQALVRNSENTSAAVPGVGRSVSVTDWISWRNRRADDGCSATQRQSEQAEQAEQAASDVGGGRGHLARARAGIAIVNPCRPLLIPRLCEPTSPARSGRPDDRLRDAIQGPRTPGWIASPPFRLVAMTPLPLPRPLRLPPLNPVCSGGEAGPRGGHAPLPPPPSPPTESGERP
jgi:hypothetical protein